jgi:Ran GTPase-activating protein (RanGAP) involved in mRNA processing and transport
MKNFTLKSLNLAGNGLSGPKTGLFLMKAINRCKLEELNLEFNSFSSAEAEKLVKALKKATYLRELNVAHNYWMEDDIVAFIGVFLNSTTSLKILQLGDDKWVTKEAADWIATIAPSCPDVKILFKGILMNNPPRPVNVKEMLFNRAKFLGMKPKRKKRKKDLG